ncbi:hypothetical protein FKM82_021933, partial [Ascaphus truei]
MSWAVLLLALTSLCACCHAQYVLTQEPLVTVSPSGSVTLSCHLNTGTIVDSNYPYWFQKRLGQVPRVLIYNTNARPSGVPERFSGSKSGSSAYLTISAVQAEDDANYYCLMWFNSVTTAH